MLQQTRVQQGLPYYERFIEAFPTVHSLAAASEQDVLRLWQGLGYYSRARNLHACAQKVVNDHNGLFPDNYRALLQLPGIGKYTAAAIASFAFKELVAVVDGNVYRVLARIFAITTDISEPSAYKEFFSLAQQLIDPEQPGTFNQAIMEFGAMHCTPQKPLCLYCPLQGMCQAFLLNMQKELPVKKKRIKVKDRYFHYFLITPGDGTFLMKRRKVKDIWQGLFDFYLLEDSSLREPHTINDLLLQQLLTQNSILINESEVFQHQLTHQRLHVKFFEIKSSLEVINVLLETQPELGLFSLAEIQDLPKPVLITNYLDKRKF